MRHDVLCATYGFASDPGQGEWGYEPPVRPCDCSRFAEVRRHALQAAWDAVAALIVDEDGWDQHNEWINDALTAIDALRGES